MKNLNPSEVETEEITVLLVKGTRNIQDENGSSIEIQLDFWQRTRKLKSCLLLPSYMTQFLHRVMVRVKEDITQNVI